MTQRKTFPFLIAESGAASFTEAVTTSPRPARSPRSPPRGRIHASRRAPLLSATSRMVLIPIIRDSGMSDFYVQIFGRDGHHARLPTDFAQPPALQLAQRPPPDNPPDVPRL